jgi:hypothetical protein
MPLLERRTIIQNRHIQLMHIKLKTFRNCLTKMILIAAIANISTLLTAADPTAVNPFAKPSTQRDDALPGYLELSDGSIRPGQIFLTREKRLIIADEQSQRQREIPLSAVKQIDSSIKKEWMEKEWKFKELTKDEKMFTGRSYPAREYVHTIRLNDGRKITGDLSAIVYVQSKSDAKAEQFILHKRDKGKIGDDLQSLIYVKSIKLGKDAYEEGKLKAGKKKKIDK